MRMSSLAGEIERGVPGLGEGLAAPGLAQLLGAEGVAADGARGLAGGAGHGERGDEGALVLGGPIVGVGAARDRRECEDVGDGGEGGVAGAALGAALLADHRDGGDGEDRVGGELGLLHWLV